MAIVELDDIKRQVNQSLAIDDIILGRKITAAQSHLESLLGFKIEERYPPTAGDNPQSTVPPALVECVLQLAAHWYESRESVLVGVNAQPLPTGFDDIVQNFRDYSFGEE